MGLASLVSGAVEVGSRFAGHIGHVCQDTFLWALNGSALGLGLGSAASARRGLLGKLPLTGFAVSAVWCAGMRASGLARAGVHRPFAGVCLLAGLLASAKAVAFGLALAERLDAARRRAMDVVRTEGEAAW